MYYIALVVFAGCIVALQPPINAALSRTVGRFFWLSRFC